MSADDAPTEEGEGRSARLGRADALLIALLALTLIPFVIVIFGGVGRSSPLVVAAVTGLAIVAAALFLSWATETLEITVPVSAALALLALIEVLPEYSFEVVLAWERRIELAASSMTGSNRLLLGVGWPLIFFVAYFAARARRRPFRAVEIPRALAADVLFLSAATVYAVLIAAKATLGLLDAVVLIALYVAYIVNALRSGRTESEEEEEEEGEPGIVGKLQRLPGIRRALVVVVFLAFGAFVIGFGAEPFIAGLIASADSLGVPQFFLIQWVAPFLAEFPESLTAFLWAATIVSVARGLGNLVSAKLNQWTLLIATIPIVYSLSLGHPAEIALVQLSRDEILLTAAQTLLGVAMLARLRLTLFDAVLLLALFLTQFAVPAIRLEVAVAYVLSAAAYCAIGRSPLPLVRALRSHGSAESSE